MQYLLILFTIITMSNFTDITSSIYRVWRIQTMKWAYNNSKQNILYIDNKVHFNYNIKKIFN